MVLTNQVSLEFHLFVQVTKNLRKFKYRFPKRFDKFHEWFIKKKLGSYNFLTEEKTKELIIISKKDYRQRIFRLKRRILKDRNKEVLGFR